MSSVCGKLDFKDFETCSIPTQCSKGSEHTSHVGTEDAQEPDGDETGYIDQIAADKSTSASLPPESSDDEEKDDNLTTTPVILIPAIKGSREKHGLSLKKSTVSWAADVYDPPPSIASHTRSKKQQQKSNHRKTGKKGQKSKDNSSSHGGSSKDKKQASRKHTRNKFEWPTQVPIVAASS